MKRNKCKKILIFTIVIYALLIQKIFAYSVKITKDNLTEAFNSYAKNYHRIQVTDTQLVNSTDEANIVYIDYNIEDVPTFSINQEINSQTDLEKINYISDRLREPLIGLIGVAIAQGMSTEDAFNYYISDVGMYLGAFKADNFMWVSSENQVTIQVGEESKTFNKDNFDVSELIKLLFGEEKQIVKNDEKGIYTYTVTITQKSTDNYNVEAKFAINKDADFSKIAPLNSNNTSNNKDNTESNEDNNKTNSDENNKNNENTENTNNIKNDILNTSTSTNNNYEQINSVNNNANQIANQQLPKTGDNTNMITLFIIIMSVCVITFIIKLNKYKDF